MTKTTKTVSLALLSIMLSFICVFLAISSYSRASATVNDSIFNNYIENGDFESEFKTDQSTGLPYWGVNGVTPERIDEGDGNYVGKIASGGFVQARIWNAGFMYDNVYKISFKLKLVSSDAEATVSTAQYLGRLKGNDGAFLGENYVAVGCESGQIALNEWKTYTYYLKVADNRNGTYSVLAGMDYNNLAQIGATATVELSYLDVAIGCGNFGNLSEWYIDDYTMVNYTEYTKNIVTNGDFSDEYDHTQIGGWGYYTQPERVQLDDGNFVGKVNVTGGFWVAPRIWNASFMYDKTYRVSFNVKLVGKDDATNLSGGQFLVDLSSNDNGHIPSGTYIDIGLNEGCAIGAWKTVTYFIRIEKGETADVLYTGTTATNLTKKIDCLSTGLSHFNPIIGCGAPGNVTEMYLDDYMVSEYTGNIVENSDMSGQFTVDDSPVTTGWGMNSFATTSERVYDEDKQSYVIANTGGGWIGFRPTVTFGKIYRLSAQLKQTVASGNVHFLLRLNGQDATGQYSGVLINSSSALNTWIDSVYYFKLEVEDGNVVLYSGNTKDSIAKSTTAVIAKDDYTHLDIHIGPHGGTWYLDNVDMFMVSPDSYDSTITITDADGNAVNDFTYEIISGINSGASVSGNVLTVTGIDGEAQVKIFATGYLDTTVNVTEQTKEQAIKLESAYYNATITVTDADSAAVEDFEINVTGTKTDATVSGNVITVTGALGDVSVEISKQDYVTTTVTLTKDNAAQTVKLASSITKYTATVTVTDDADNAINGYTYEVTGRVDGEKTLEGNVLTITDAVGEITVKISADRYLEENVSLTATDKAKTVKLVNAPYTATLTVKETDGTEVTDFEYEVEGTYTSHSVEGNIITVVGAVKDLSVTITKAYYADLTVTVTDLTAVQNVTFDKRATVEDPTDYSNLLFGFDSFEGLELTNTPSASLDNTNYQLPIFIHGSGPSIAVTERDSHYGSHSLLVHSTGDRFVTRLIGRGQTILKDTEYHVTYWVKSTGGNIDFTPYVHVSYWLVGENYDHGALHDLGGNLKLGNAVTVTDSAWTKIEVIFSYSISGDELTIYFGDGKSETFTATDEIYDVNLFDLSLTAKGDWYLDDITFAKAYNASVEVLDANGDPVTEGVTVTVKDYVGAVMDITPTIQNGKLCYEGVYGTVAFTAEYNGKIYEGTTSITYPDIILADEYTATVKVVNGAGEVIDDEDIYEIYAQDGASRIDGTYNSETYEYTFSGAMGDLKIFVIAQDYEQHNFYIVTRKNADVILTLTAVGSSLDGLRGNLALNGDVEELSQIEMYNKREYAIDGVGNTGANNRYASFGPVLTLSDESVVGEKSLRISSNTADLRKDDAEYDQFMIDNDLDDAVLGDRVSYRGSGADYATDGTVYRFTTYLKAPATQQGVTQVDIIYLMVINLCNNGAFNYWVPVTIEIGNEYWSKLEILFSYELVEDEAAAAANKYEYARNKLLFTTKMVLNGETLCDYSGSYGYEQYKDGTYAFYSYNDKGEFYGWGDLVTDKHDGFDESGNGIKNQEGGRSFGTFAYCEPSFQIKNNKSLLVDGTNIVYEYTADVTVYNKDLTYNSEVAYFRLTDKFTGLVSYVSAAEYYDEIDQKYYIPSLFNAFDVAVCDTDKVVISGIDEQLISAENGKIILEYSYDIQITLKDKDGNAITDVDVRITLANGNMSKLTNNNDGTYTYTGLSGVRAISFRKTGENSWEFPKNVTVSSANNQLSFTLSVKVEESEEPSSGDDKESSGGCGSSVAAGSIFAAVTLLAGSAMALKKKR